MPPIDHGALKLEAARAAINYVVPGDVLGVGSGSTVNAFIGLLEALAQDIPGAVAASEASGRALRAVGIRVLDLNEVARLGVYVDGADEIDANMCAIKGGGAALTREKILADAATNFVCIVDASKRVRRLGGFPLPIEVVPMATGIIFKRLIAMGGQPVLRTGVVTARETLNKFLTFRVFFRRISI